MQLDKFNPINWSLHCWVLFSFWLMATVWVNIPWFPSTVDLANGDHPFAKHLVSDGEFYLHAGWPHPYLERKYQGQSATITNQWMWDGLATNILLALPTLYMLVFVLQYWLPRLSLRTIFIAIAIVALVIQVGVTMFSGINSREAAIRYQLFLISIYHSPLVIGIVLLLVSTFAKFTAKRRITK